MIINDSFKTMIYLLIDWSVITDNSNHYSQNFSDKPSL